MANVALHPEAEREYDKSYSLLTMQNMCNDCCVQQIQICVLSNLAFRSVIIISWTTGERNGSQPWS